VKKKKKPKEKNERFFMHSSELFIGYIRKLVEQTTQIYTTVYVVFFPILLQQNTMGETLYNHKEKNAANWNELLPQIFLWYHVTLEYQALH